MPRVERICPECGASNSFKQANCEKCRAPLTRDRSTQTPVLSRGGMAKLAWRATKFLTRAGLRLARSSAQRGMEQIQKRTQPDAKNETIDAEYNLREWRVWSHADPKPTEPTERVHWGPKK